MPVWRCPHCATPQAEASRCWVCRRSTTSCVTCRHYRRGISGGIGLCGLDPRHAAVADTDVRACWVGATPAPEESQPALRPAAAEPARTGATAAGARTPRTFVPIESVAPRPGPAAVAVLERIAEPPLVAAAEAVREPASNVEPALPADAIPVMAPAPTPARPIPGRWWLWGDPDPWPERLGERWA